MNEDIKSFYAAIILSLILIFATNYFFFKKDDVVATPQVNVSQPETETAAADGKDEAKDAVPLSTEEAVAANPGVKISTPALTGSFRTRGFRIDNLWLEKYKQTLSPDSPDVELLTPAKTANPYYAEFGWLAADPAVRLPDAHTLWTVKGRELTDKTPVVLEWDNQQGLKFITKISLDENYLFTVSQSVENNTGKNVTLYPYGLIARAPGAVGGRGVVHEGMIGVMDGTLEEIKYDDVKDENKEFTTTGGWLGFSDRYWFSAIVVNPETESRVKFSKSGNGLYQADFVGSPVTVVPGSVGSDQVMFYAGAKEIKLLDQYTSERRIPKFDLAVDFGWYYFLTKPFFYILDFLYGIIGNMGWAILLFAALLRLVMFPIANKSYESMAKMKKIQPMMKQLQEKHGKDKEALSREMMQLYKTYGVNPMGGCLPILIQLPVFVALYQALLNSIALRHASFITYLPGTDMLWLADLSARDPYYITPLVMGATMLLQQWLSPAMGDPTQRKMMMLMPVIFTVMFLNFPAGLVIYWLSNNILSIAQQWWTLRKA